MKKIVILLLAVLLTLATSCSSNMIEQTKIDDETVGSSLNEQPVSSSSGEQPVISDNQETPMNSKGPFVYPGGGFYTYQYIERYFTLNDLVKIEIGMTLTEITDILGEPNGVIGSGFICPYYVTYDNACIELDTMFLEPDSQLCAIRIIDPSGRVYELQEDKQESDDAEQPVNSDESFIFPGGGLYSYTFIERNITLGDLAKIEIGMTNKEITDILGDPNGFWGSETSYAYYITYDNACIVLYTKTGDPNSKLKDIYIVDQIGRWYELHKKQE